MLRRFFYANLPEIIVLGCLSATLLVTVSILYELCQPYMIRTRMGAQVVKLVKPSNHGTGGTGFVIKAPSGKLYTLTNAHVCALNEVNAVDALKSEDSQYINIRIIAVSPVTDLCILEAVPGLSGLSTASYSDVGEAVSIIGHPFLLPRTYAAGYLNNISTIDVLFKVNGTKEECTGQGYEYLTEEQDPMMALFGFNSICIRTLRGQLTSIQTFPGNSGSPVFNYWGNVAGVIFAGSNNTNYGYIIPIDDVNHFLEEF